jgi:hypothetical protein
MKRGSAAIESDTMLSAAEPGEILLELNYIRAEAKGTVVEGARDSGINFFPDSSHLGGQIKVRNGFYLRG